jgi:hypothetical protein
LDAIMTTLPNQPYYRDAPRKRIEALTAHLTGQLALTFRTASRLQAKEVANALKITLPSYYRVETGARTLKATEILVLCELYQVLPSTFLAPVLHSLHEHLKRNTPLHQAVLLSPSKMNRSNSNATTTN